MEQRDNDGTHASSLCETACNLNRHNTYRVSGRHRLRMMLELAGDVVYEATDGVRGIEWLNVVRPHVAIIDVTLPGKPGDHRQLMLGIVLRD